MSFNELKQSIMPGLKFEKTNVQSSILAIDPEGFIYSIGQNGKYKKVTYESWENVMTISFPLMCSGGICLTLRSLQLQSLLNVISQQLVVYFNTLVSLPIKV